MSDAALVRSPPRPRLRRSRDDRVIAGVCGGLGTFFGIDPVWFRIAFVVMALGGGSGLLIYLIAWLAIPEADEYDEEAVPVAGNGAGVVVGLIFITIGVIALINQFIPWFDEIIWQSILIAIGAGLVIGGWRR